MMRNEGAGGVESRHFFFIKIRMLSLASLILQT